MKILVIDDLRFPRHPIFDNATHVDIARNSAQGFHFLESDEYSAVFWDHDLGGDDTTRPIALWLEELGFNGNPVPIETCYLHTSNGVGANWLFATLNSRVLDYQVYRVDALEYFTA